MSPKILIGICSSLSTASRRAAVRATWMQNLPTNTEAVFFVGRGAADSEPAVVEVPAADDYASLPTKVREFFRYALASHQFDYLFKCDDDTYVVSRRLLDLASDGASFVGSSVSAPYGYASGGAGYLLSRAAVSAVAEASPPAEGAEDVWITALLGSKGFSLTPSPYLRPDREQLPDLDNAIVTAHYCSPEVMSVAQTLMTPCHDAGIVVAAFHARHATWQGPLRLFRNGTFLGGAAAPDGRWQWDSADQALFLHWSHWPYDRLVLREWGLESPAIRLEFARDFGLHDWQGLMIDIPSTPCRNPVPLEGRTSFF